MKKGSASSFFQSELFGKFQEKIPGRGRYWDVDGCIVVRQKLPLGFCWLWVPYGPAAFSVNIFEKIAEIAHTEKALFVRVEPPMDWDINSTVALGNKWQMRKTAARYTPEHTLVLDIKKPETEILAQMKPKGRYNIRVAEKNGVCVEAWGGDEKAFMEFYEILKKTGGRDGFGIHPADYYLNLLKTFSRDSELLLARSKGGAIVAGIIVIYFNGVATYFYGASDHEHRSLMAPYLLQWEAIKRAKQKDCRAYDFLGIAPDDQSHHAWAGVTKFKKQFGGTAISYASAFEIVYRPLWYFLYRLVKRLI